MNWIWQIAFKKGIQRAIQLIVAWLISHGITQMGVTLDETALTVSAMAGLEVLRNWLKVKLGWKWL